MTHDVYAHHEVADENRFSLDRLREFTVARDRRVRERIASVRVVSCAP